MLASDHAAQQGLPVWILASLAGLNSGVALALGTAGALANSAPDSWPLVRGLLDPDHPKVSWEDVRPFGVHLFYAPYRWDVYLEMHERRDSRKVNWLWWLHTWEDRPFHKKLEGVRQVDWDANVNKVRGWWPRLWYLAVPIWLLEVGLVVLRIKI